MELTDFLQSIQAEVRSQDGGPYSEIAFTERVMAYMDEIGMTNEAQPCHHESTYGNARLRLSGYALSDEADRLDLFVSLYKGVDEVTSIPDVDTKQAAKQCFQFLMRCQDGTLEKKLDPSSEAFGLSSIIRHAYKKLDDIRIFVLTDCKAKAKSFKAMEAGGKTVQLEVMDIERLYRHWGEGKAREDLVADFLTLSGQALPCVFLPGDGANFDCVLTAIPGEALRVLYEKHGARLLEANVRSFLSTSAKVNKGIRETLIKDPTHFLAYNNGLVLIADEIGLRAGEDGSSFLTWLKGIQIVNGGQTTASIYFTKKKRPETDISRVRVPAKILILQSIDDAYFNQMVSDISKYANSQNVVKLADLSANKPFHVEVEKLSTSIYMPDGVGRWFYERATGSYNVWLARATPSQAKSMKLSVPPKQKVTKTDLAKFLNTWDQKPQIVSQGNQKNFDNFMAAIDSNPQYQLPISADDYKKFIAKSILFKEMTKPIRKHFKAFQANITTYTLSVCSLLLGNKLDLDRIWRNQRLSPQLEAQILTWATEVHAEMERTSGGRMLSEWAKKDGCWDAVREKAYSQAATEIPELQ